MLCLLGACLRTPVDTQKTINQNPLELFCGWCFLHERLQIDAFLRGFLDNGLEFCLSTTQRGQIVYKSIGDELQIDTDYDVHLIADILDENVLRMCDKVMFNLLSV